MGGARGLVVPDGGAYQLALVAHLLAVIVGFGGLVVARRMSSPPTGLIESRLEWAMYSVPVLGVVLVMLSGDRWHFSEPWIGASFLAYAGAVGVHQIGRRRKEPVLGPVFDVLVVVAVVLMVVKPGA